MAFLQRDLKRLLAFVTISHVGVFLAALGLLTPRGLAGSTLYVITDGFVKAALFLAVGILIHRAGSGDELRLRGLGVVSGRPDEGVRDVRVAREHGFRRGEGGACRGERSLPRALGDGRRPGEDAPSVGAECSDRLDVRGIVDELELLRIRVPTIPPTDVFRKRPSLEDRLHVEHPDGVLGMELRLGQEGRGRLLEDAASGVVEERVVVPEDVDGH